MSDTSNTDGADVEVPGLQRLYWDEDRGRFTPERPKKLLRRDRQRFMPRIPEQEYCRAAACGPACAVLYTVLVQQCLLHRATQVKVTTAMLAKVSLSRGQKERALHALAQDGLITVERRSGKNPVVTVLAQAARREDVPDR